MDKPFKFTVVDLITKKCYCTNILPSQCETHKYNKKGVRVKVKEVYIDTRYKAKLRLYNYITYTKNGLDIPRYRPFEGTEIGKSIPILNF